MVSRARRARHWWTSWPALSMGGRGGLAVPAPERARLPEPRHVGVRHARGKSPLAPAGRESSGMVETDCEQVRAPVPCPGRPAAGLRHTEPGLRVLELVMA